MSFAAFGENPLADLIETASESQELGLVIGAGASMEAGLPSWDRLLDRLLLRGGERAGLIPELPEDREADADQQLARDRWLEDAARDGPLGKAALAEALAETNRDQWIAEALYGADGGPGKFHPGPIAQQVPHLDAAFGRNLRIMTLNYDDLIEQALRQHGRQPHAISGTDHQVPADRIGVIHLHGYLGRDERPRGQLVLSEADYMQMQQATSWQETDVHHALAQGPVIFVGTSLLDPNVIRYLHGVDQGPKRFALFVRQNTYPAQVPTSTRRAREQALGKRWEALGVTAVFLDHYSDVAQALAEIAHRKAVGADAYVPLAERASTWLATVERDVIAWGRAEEQFVLSQYEINTLLRTALSAAVEAAKQVAEAEWDETLQLALWLADPDGKTLTNWVMTDRLHLDQKTIEPVRVDEYARWVAIRAYCAGASIAESRGVYASRWRFVRGTPLVLERPNHERIPVGCLTTASLLPGEETQLNQLAGEVLAAFNRTLAETAFALLEQPFQEGA